MSEDILIIAPLHHNTVHVSVNNQKTVALVDTGASISCISRSFLEKCGIDKTKIIPSSLSQVVGVSGNKVSVLGKVEIPFVIDGACLTYPFHVLDQFQHKLILGIDFLYDNKCSIDLSKGQLYIHEGILCASLTVGIGCAKTLKPVTIPAKGQINVPVCLNSKHHKRVVLLEPVPSDVNIRVARCLVKAKRSSNTKSKKCQAVVRILNPTDEDVLLPGNFTVASVTLVDSKDVVLLDNEGATESCANVHLVSDKTFTDSADSENMTFNVSNSNLTKEQCSRLQAFLRQNSDVFSTSFANIGKTNMFTHRIETDEGAKPIHRNYYRQNPLQRAEIERQCKDFLDHGLISHSDSVWHSPVVLVKKKDQTYRFAIDYRALNKITKSISHPLPRLDDVLDSVGESAATIFSTLDLNSAYFQMELDPETKHKSAFITHEGVFVWNRMPFGLKNAPMSFQMLMSQVLRGLNWKIVLCYIDDILVFSRTFDEHLSHLGQVFAKLRQANLTLKPEKCKFGVEKVLFLGHFLSKDGVSVDPVKIEKVKSFPVPKSQTELKSFIGLCNYYRRFVDGFARIVSPLNKLLKAEKRGKFKEGDWTEACQNAFEKLKGALTSAPILNFPDMNKPFILSTDASGTAIGYVLGQVDSDGNENVIAYGGRALSGDEKKWSVFDQECLAVVEGITTYRHYLSRKFTVFTDHKALSYLHKIKNPVDRVARWCMFLQGFDYEILYKPGKHNTNADAISRIPYSNDNSLNVSDIPQASPKFDPGPLTNVDLMTVSSDQKCGCENSLSTDSTLVNIISLTSELSRLTTQGARLLLSLMMLLTLVLTCVSTKTVRGISKVLSMVSEKVDNIREKYLNAPHRKSCSHITHKFLTEVNFEFENTGSVFTLDPLNQVIDEDMSALQRKCPDCDFLIDYLETRVLPLDEKKQRMCLRAEEQFVLKDGVLFHFYQPKHKGKVNVDDHFVFQLVVPRCKRKELIENYHDNLAGGGHFGISRTFAKLRQKYWFPGMYQEIKAYVVSCDNCQRSKIDRHQHPPPLHPLPVEEPMSRVHMDILGPLPKTKDGHQYILLVIDSFTKWPEAFPLKTQSAHEIANVLYHEVFCRYGAPRSLVSDRGKNFMSKLVSALCELLNIKRYHTSAYHPQSNSTVERSNSILAKALSAYVDENQSNWAKLLPSIMYSFRVTPSTESSGFSPFHLLFGREMTLPVDINVLPKPTLPSSTREYLEDLIQQLKISHDVAKKNMEFQNTKSKNRFDKTAKAPDFKVNDKVLLRQHASKPGLSPKLAPKWNGPYVIVTVGPKNTYYIKDCSSNKTHTAQVNAQRLKHYHERLDPLDEEDSDSENESAELPNVQYDASSQPPPKDDSDSESQDGLNDQLTGPSVVQPDAQSQPGSSQPVSDAATAEANKTAQNHDEVPPSQGSQVPGDHLTSSKLHWPIKIKEARWYQNMRWFLCKLPGVKNYRWITEPHINPQCIDNFLASHTMAGKARKRRKKKKPSNFIDKKDEAQ